MASAMRREAFPADGEEVLERLQADFLSRHEQPAATATRITRRSPAAAAPAAAVKGHAHPPAATPSRQDEGIAATTEDVDDEDSSGNGGGGSSFLLPGVMGAVRERQPQQRAPRPPTGPAAGAAFPIAMHRSKSKFARAREARQVAAQQPATPSGATGGGVPSGGVIGAAPPAPAGDGSAVDAENRAVLAAMTPEQIEAAKAEALSRLPPKTAEFLRRRGRQHSAAGTAAEPAEPSAAPAATGGGAAKQQAAASAVGAPQLGSQPPASGAYAASAARQQGQQDDQGRMPAAGYTAAARRRQPMHISSDEAAAGQAPPEAAVARLRYRVGGQPAGFAPPSASAVPSASDVLRRDPLRQDEATAPSEGTYTLLEAAVLARSSVPGQRAAGLRLLAAVLEQARPKARDLAAGSSEPAARPVQLPHKHGATAAGAGAAASVDWADVWQHALNDVEVALVARRGLDDSHHAVIAAAAGTTGALLGSHDAEITAAQESADAHPFTGWPAPAYAHARRPHPLGAWVFAPLAADPEEEQQPPEPPQGMALVQSPPAAEDDAALAAEDPLTGLLRMQLLERIRYLLEVARPPAAIAPLLAILASFARAGKDLALAVLRCPRMGDALLSILLAPPPPSPQQRQTTAGSPVSRTGSAADGAVYGARPAAAALLRVLVQSSPAAARLAHAAGLLSIVNQLLAAGQGPAAAGRPTLQHGDSYSAALQVEGLRLWRVCTLYDVPTASLDALWPLLAAHFSGPSRAETPETLAIPAAELFTPAASAGGSGRSGSGGGGAVAAAAAQAALAREALLTAAELVCHAARHPNAAMVSAECAAAVAGGAAQWLSQPLAAHSSASQSGSTHSQMASNIAQLGAFAAAAHFAATYLTAVRRSAALAAPQQAQAEVLAAVLHSGLLSSSADAARGDGVAADGGGAAQGGSSVGQTGEAPQMVAHLLATLQRSFQEPAADTVATAAASAAAAEALDGIVSLAAAVMASVQPASAEAAAADETIAAIGNVVSPLVAQLAAQQSPGTALSPASAAVVQQQSHLLRLAAACRTIPTGADQGQLAGAMSQGALQQVDAALASLALLPAGSEAAGLAALDFALSQHSVAPLLAVAHAELQSLQVAGGWAGWAAAGGTASGFPLPLSPPAAAAARQVMLRSYAAAWLGLVVAEGAAPSGSVKPEAGGTGSAAAPQPLDALVLQPAGSRLPAPLAWPLLEPWHPGTSESQGSSSGGSGGGSAADAVGAALMWLLGLEAAGSAYVAAIPAVAKLAGVLALLLAPDAPGADGGSPIWTEPAVRWPAAALLNRYHGASISGEVSATTAVRWAEHFTAGSYGDALLGAALLVLLRPDAPSAVQEETLAALTAHRAARLLPPLSQAPGGPTAYLTHPDTDSQKGKLPPRVLEQLAALLADGELDTAAGGAGAAGGCRTAVSAATHNAEPSMLMDMALHFVLAPLLAPPAAGESEASMLQRQAQLRGILRRRPVAALPAMLRRRVSWTSESLAVPDATQQRWRRVVQDLPDHELQQRRQVVEAACEGELELRSRVAVSGAFDMDLVDTARLHLGF